MESASLAAEGQSSEHSVELRFVSAGDEAPQVAQIVRAMDEAAGMTGAPRYAACAPAELPKPRRPLRPRLYPMPPEPPKK